MVPYLSRVSIMRRRDGFWSTTDCRKPFFRFARTRAFIKCGGSCWKSLSANDQARIEYIWRMRDAGLSSGLEQYLMQTAFICFALTPITTSHPNAPVLEQGLASFTRRRVIRSHITSANSGRIAPPLRQDLVSDRDSRSLRS
jgi:hypothetical protein